MVGEAGVGKTAIVESLAHRIANNNMRLPAFQNARIIQIEAGTLVAGTSHRGDFEERMKCIIEEATEAEDAILFIDEIHMLMGAGGGSGSAMDAANILKPALQSGGLKLIGATTYAEYSRYILSDAALERRFEVIRVSEPTSAETLEILKSLQPSLEKHHQVTITEEALTASVTLSQRYMLNRRMPDKARDVLDTACTMTDLFVEISFRAEDDNAGSLGGGFITLEEVRKAVSQKTGIPVERLSQDERKRILQMADALKARVIGQDKAASSIARAIQNYYADMGSGKRPIGVFLFVGPTGVGKTQLAKATAEFLFGIEEQMIRIDMTEFGEEHSVSRLIGSPPGYVGHEQGGYLTEALRRNPFSVVLLDEIEKAHEKVVQILLQVFDDGRLTDGRGNTVFARNALFIMTSNVGYHPEPDMKMSPPSTITPDSVMQAVRKHFRPEFLNRIDETILFNALKPEHMPDVVEVHLKPLREQLLRVGIKLDVKKPALQWLADHGYDERFGARQVRRVIEEAIASPIRIKHMTNEFRAGHTVIVEVIPPQEAAFAPLPGSKMPGTIDIRAVGDDSTQNHGE